MAPREFAAGSANIGGVCSMEPNLILLLRNGARQLGILVLTSACECSIAADTGYMNAQRNSDKQTARIEHDKAVARVMTAVLTMTRSFLGRSVIMRGSGGGWQIPCST